MNRIIKKENLNDSVTRMVIDAPLVALKAMPGQFIILRVDEFGERIPLTIADSDSKNGTVTIIFQVVGASTMLLNQLNEGDFIQDFVGPLGEATSSSDAFDICIIGGGVGCAIAYPQAKALHAQGKHVDVITGFRTKDLIILEEEFTAASDHLYITTDDGSYAQKGFVTDVLNNLINEQKHYDLVIAIGPVVMMRSVCELTRIHDIKTIVSLNPIMIDGTGMCGGCRVVVDGEQKFACVDGPDFDGHLVDFDSLSKRNTYYSEQEKHSRENCRLLSEKK
jgi:ferredoxin--NADP+ reductase